MCWLNEAATQHRPFVYSESIVHNLTRRSQIRHKEARELLEHLTKQSAMAPDKISNLLLKTDIATIHHVTVLGIRHLKTALPCPPG